MRIRNTVDIWNFFFSFDLFTLFLTLSGAHIQIHTHLLIHSHSVAYFIGKTMHSIVKQTNQKNARICKQKTNRIERINRLQLKNGIFSHWKSRETKVGFAFSQKSKNKTITKCAEHMKINLHFVYDWNSKASSYFALDFISQSDKLRTARERVSTTQQLNWYAHWKVQKPAKWL